VDVPVVIDHYHTHKVRFASLKGPSASEGSELIFPAILLLIIGSAVLVFLQPSRRSVFWLWGDLPGFLAMFGILGAVFFALAYAGQIVPRVSLWSISILGSAVALASILGAVWLHREYEAIEVYAREIAQEPIKGPSAWGIGSVFAVYGAVMAIHAVMLLMSRRTA
jgi:hypothetical protein